MQQWYEVRIYWNYPWREPDEVVTSRYWTHTWSLEDAEKEAREIYKNRMEHIVKFEVSEVDDETPVGRRPSGGRGYSMPMDKETITADDVARAVDYMHRSYGNAEKKRRGLSTNEIYGYLLGTAGIIALVYILTS